MQYRVQNGQRVKRVDLIALTGYTGGNYDPHLHYEIKDINGYQYYKNNGYRDPRTMDIPALFAMQSPAVIAELIQIEVHEITHSSGA